MKKKQPVKKARKVPAPKNKVKSSSFIDDGKLYLEVIVDNNTSRVKSFLARWLGEEKSFAVKGGNILAAWKSLEKWLGTRKGN